MTTLANKKSLKIHAKLGFTHLETAEIVENLNKLLCNYQVHYQKLRNFHWNITGSSFFELHKQLEEEYNDVKVHIDDIAERIRVFGKFPISTMQEYLDLSEIKEVKHRLTSFEMIKEVLNDFEIMLGYLNAVSDSAKKIGDSGTEDMITTFIKNMEKKHWMFTAWLKS